MLGSLLRRLVIFPIPPAHAGRASAIAVLTALMVMLSGMHTFGGVIGAALTATATVLFIEVLILVNRRPQ